MVLVVDDKPENILPLRKILELNGFDVDTALSGEEALLKVLKHDYTLIVLDVQMPGMDGFEVAEALSGYSKGKDIPIIFLSAVNTEKRFISKGYEAGGIDYVTKPVDPDVLIMKVKTFNRLHEQTLELKRIQRTLEDEIDYRKRAQEELNETALQLRSTLEAIPQVAFTLSPTGEIEYTNNHWYRYSPSAKRWPQLYPDDEKKFHEAWMNAIASGEPVEIEVRIKDASLHSYSWHLMRAIPVKEHSRVIKWVGTFTDIDEQKEIEKKKDEFISIASHELKTPLTSIKAYFQLMERLIKEGSYNGDATHYVEKTNTQIDKLNQLISDLLDVSKIHSGKLEFHRKKFDFDQLLQSTIESIQQMHPGYTITKKGDARVQVYADANRIEQVLVNYLTNAIKYSPHANKVDITVTSSNKEVEVCVRDYGIGIPKEKADKVFQKFYRAEESSKFQGLGIGLYICAEIITRHGGRFGVKSEVNQGSEFYFTLPVAGN